jgi:Transposase IS66 family
VQSARKVLGGFRGTAVADGYKVYEILSRAGPFRLAHCWAHYADLRIMPTRCHSAASQAAIVPMGSA